MPFGSNMTERAPQNEQKEKVDSPFIKLTAQVPEMTIRLLDHEPTVFWRYWLNVNLGTAWDGRPVIVGPKSPIRERMLELGADSPQFRKPGKRAYINVLDRTLDANGNPKNKVMIWEVGTEIVESLQILDGRQINRQTREKMRIWEFDLDIVRVDRQGRAFTAVSPNQNDEPLSDDVLNQPRYDLAKMAQPMPDEAQRRLLNGESYYDVRKSLGWDSAYPMVTPDELPF